MWWFIVQSIAWNEETETHTTPCINFLIFYICTILTYSLRVWVKAMRSFLRVCQSNNDTEQSGLLHVRLILLIRCGRFVVTFLLFFSGLFSIFMCDENLTISIRTYMHSSTQSICPNSPRTHFGPVFEKWSSLWQTVFTELHGSTGERERGHEGKQ